MPDESPNEANVVVGGGPPRRAGEALLLQPQRRATDSGGRWRLPDLHDPSLTLSERRQIVARKAARARTITRTLNAVAVGLVALIASVGIARRFEDRPALTPVEAAAVAGDTILTVASVTRPMLSIADSLFGRSGKLRFLSQSTALVEPGVAEMLGDSAAHTPGIYPVATDSARRPFLFITMRPFQEKLGAHVGPYHVGYWPAERRNVRTTSYENPEGFIEVTRENQDTYVSDHFRLRDFLTHDQANVWPKYLVLREALIDKLELVIADIELRGVPVNHVVVLSGFRTPQYNALGVGERGGRANDSRHQYGDAADILIDNNRDGRMDDLNGDRRVDIRDVRVISDAVDNVERRYPDLVGGVGHYHAMGPSGPFAHIDVRGYRARWGNMERLVARVRAGNSRARGAAGRASSTGPRAAGERRVRGCIASGASAVLCGGR